MATFQLGFTLGELLAEIGKGEQEDLQGAHTTREWCELLGCPERRMLTVLRQALKRGMLLRGRGPRELLDGVTRRVAVYAFKIDKEGEST